MDANISRPVPKISVLMPVYNAGPFLVEAIDSILNQTFTDFELILINDASTDGSLEVIKGYSDERIVIIDNVENRGIVKNLNDAILKSRGVYLARMDADDIAVSSRFEKQVALLDGNPELGLCGAWHERIGDLSGIHKYPVTNKDIDLQLILNPAFSHPTIMFRKSALIESGLNYNEDFIPAEDYNLWVRLMDKIRGENIPEVLHKYRLHNSNISITKKRKQQAMAALARSYQIRRILGPSLYNDAELELLSEAIGTIGAGNEKRLDRQQFALIEDFCILFKQKAETADSHKEELIKGVKFLANDLYLSSFHLGFWLVKRASRSSVFSLPAVIRISVRKTFPNFYDWALSFIK